MGVEQIGQRARTEFDEDDSKPSTSRSENGSSSKENTRLFGEGQLCRSAEQLHPINLCSVKTTMFLFAGRDRSKSTSSPFGGSGSGTKRAANPFGPDSRSKPFIEPANLSPTMKPIPIDDTPWYKKITLGQVVSCAYGCSCVLFGLATDHAWPSLHLPLGSMSQMAHLQKTGVYSIDNAFACTITLAWEQDHFVICVTSSLHQALTSCLLPAVA